MDTKYDIITIGVAIMDSMIMGFDPVPISTAGYRAESGSLFVGGDALDDDAVVQRTELGLGHREILGLVVECTASARAMARPARWVPGLAISRREC